MFEAAGTDDSVPAYKRSAVAIPNYKWEKGKTEAIVKEVWAAKKREDERNGYQSSLADFLYKFFLKRYITPKAAVAHAVNLEQACKMWSWDADCELFYEILTGNCHEDVYTDQHHLLSQFQAYLLQQPSATGRAGYLKKEEIGMAIRRFPLFRAKAEANVVALIEALSKEVKTDAVDING